MEQNNITPIDSVAAMPHEQKPLRKYSLASVAEKCDTLGKWLEDNKAAHVIALDLTGKSPCMDAILVVTATSLRHAKSLADGLSDLCKQNMYEFLRMEGYQAAQWVLVDLNDVVVHIFQPEMRELFRIEALWKDAPVIYGESTSPAAGSAESPEL